MKSLNLNDVVKVKLTPLGVNIYYNQFEETERIIVRNGGEPMKNRMPRIDKDGFTEMQLWHFMELYGPEIGMAKPNVIQDLRLYIDEKDLEDVPEKK